MARRETYLENLRTVPLFSACSRRELGKLAKAGDELTVDDGYVLTSQGDVGREAFVVVEGQAVVKRGNRKVATLGPGDCVGELALLDHGPRTATVVADGPMTLFVLGSRQFAGVIEDVPTLSRQGDGRPRRAHPGARHQGVRLTGSGSPAPPAPFTIAKQEGNLFSVRSRPWWTTPRSAVPT